MSEYSEDFGEIAKIHLKDVNGLISQEDHRGAFENNLEVFRKEIKALQVGKILSSDTVGRADTAELADDSSEDDLSFVKYKQADKTIRVRPLQTQLRPGTKLSKPFANHKDYSCQSRNTQRKNFPALKNVLKNNKNSFFYSRPKKIIYTITKSNVVKNLSIKTRKVFEKFERNAETFCPDWEKSALKVFADSGIWEFNSRKDENLLTEEQILQNKENFSMKIMSETFKMMSKEMFYSNKYKLEEIKVELQRLLMARKTLLNLLSSIYKREDLLVTILRLRKEGSMNLEGMFSEYYSLTKSILIYIQRLKDSVLGLQCFVYSGVDYEKKIQEDLKSITKLKLF